MRDSRVQKTLPTFGEWMWGVEVVLLLGVNVLYPHSPRGFEAALSRLQLCWRPLDFLNIYNVFFNFLTIFKKFTKRNLNVLCVDLNHCLNLTIIKNVTVICNNLIKCYKQFCCCCNVMKWCMITLFYFTLL